MQIWVVLPWMYRLRFHLCLHTNLLSFPRNTQEKYTACDVSSLFFNHLVPNPSSAMASLFVGRGHFNGVPKLIVSAEADCFCQCSAFYAKVFFPQKTLFTKWDKSVIKFIDLKVYKNTFHKLISNKLLLLTPLIHILIFKKFLK